MRTLRALEIGLLFRPGSHPLETVQRVRALGLRCGQLGVPGNAELDVKAWKSALDAGRFTLVTLFAGFTGQDYTDIPATRRTVGLVPRVTRAGREARLCLLSDIAAELGAGGIACHMGFLPEDRTSLDYVAVRDIARRVADHAARRGQSFALETGQEIPDALLRFIQDVERPNIRVNFDPANLILYGAGDPIAALDTLGPYIVTVHCKDGTRDPGTPPDALGAETPLGQGAVGIGRFMARLADIGYQGPLIIEREIPEGEQRTRDIKEAIELLRRYGGQADRPD